MATIFAWTGALNKRGELDNIPGLSDFAKKLEKATVDTIESGYMTGDLAPSGKEAVKPVKLNSEEFILAIKKTLDKSL